MLNDKIEVGLALESHGFSLDRVDFFFESNKYMSPHGEFLSWGT